MYFKSYGQDANHGEITEALEDAGCIVTDLSKVGGGCPDLLVYRPATGLLRLLEVKTRKGKLERSQEEFRRRVPTWIARTPREALEALECLHVVVGKEKA